MEKAVVAAKKPELVTLEGGKTYHWCSCGQSKIQPFCDGSHRGTDFAPVKVRLQESASKLLCACKQTRNPPYCDGSHNSLADGYDEASPDEIASTQHLSLTPALGGKAQLEGGCFVVTPAAVNADRKGNLLISKLIGAEQGAKELSLFYLEADQGPSTQVSFSNGSAALFVLSGFGHITIAGEMFDIAEGQAAMVCPKEVLSLQPHADSGPIRLTATLCPQDEQPCWPTDSHGPVSSPFDVRYGQRIFSVDQACRQEMADRFYQVLVDRDLCPDDMTQFLGEVPRSRAAFHRHLYEETITILSGEGFLWTEKAKAAVAPGDVIFLPQRQLHSLECTSVEGMKLVGVFYPAGSPAINY